jgi:hypothetical protein
VWGQTPLSAFGTEYTQNFNSLTTSTTASTWTDNSTLTGWYTKTDLSTPATIVANTGATTTGALYSFGSTAATERAFGYAPSNAFTGASATGKGYLGWRLQNTTGSTISSITVTWTGEQWRRENNAAAQTLVLGYQVGATVTALTTGTWTATSSTFTSPIVGATTGVALDGNATANRTANISVVITVNIPAGQEIMLRWEDLNDSGNDHLMAIDDVTVKACPSPTVSNAIASTNWTTASTWVCGIVPTATSNVTIPAGITVALDASSSVNDITFTGGGKLTLGANDLTVNGTATGDATAGFVVTDGAGSLKQTHASAAAKVYPIGSALTKYDPVTITTPDACSFKVKVAGSIDVAYPLSPRQTGVVTPRLWDITLVSGTPTVALQLTSSDVTNAPSAPNAGMIGHWSSALSAWEALPCTYAGGTWSTSGVSSFSPFIVSQALTVLGVDLKKLGVNAKGNANLVEWSTASEKNSQSFDIQHATNGLDFVTVGNVKANGTTNIESNYSFAHANPAIGTNYYRLKQVDANGTESFSKIVSVQNGGKKAPLLVYPTLATDVLRVLTNSDKNEDFQIINLVGQTVLTGKISNGADININALTNGQYIFKTAGELARFVKN